MTHILYVPATLLLGFALGYILGARSVRRQFEEKSRATRQ